MSYQQQVNDLMRGRLADYLKQAAGAYRSTAKPRSGLRESIYSGPPGEPIPNIPDLGRSQPLQFASHNTIPQSPMVGGAREIGLARPRPGFRPVTEPPVPGGGNRMGFEMTRPDKFTPDIFGQHMNDLKRNWGQRPEPLQPQFTPGWTYSDTGGFKSNAPRTYGYNGNAPMRTPLAAAVDPEGEPSVMPVPVPQNWNRAMYDQNNWQNFGARQADKRKSGVLPSTNEWANNILGPIEKQNTMANKWAGGMMPSEAIAPTPAGGPTLKDYTAPNSPFRTVGLPVNPWGQDATKAGDKYYSAPPPPAKEPTQFLNFADWKAAGKTNNIKVGGFDPYTAISDTPTREKFLDHMEKVKELESRRGNPSMAVRAAGMAKAAQRRDRIAAAADARRGISPQQRMAMDAMRSGDGSLRDLFLGGPEYAAQVDRNRAMVDVAREESAARRKNEPSEVAKSLGIEIAMLSQQPQTPEVRRRIDELRRQLGMMEGGGIASGAAPSNLRDAVGGGDALSTSQSIITEKPDVSFDEFNRMMRSRGNFTADEIGDAWRTRTGAEPPLGYRSKKAKQKAQSIIDESQYENQSYGDGMF